MYKVYELFKVIIGFSKVLVNNGPCRYEVSDCKDGTYLVTYFYSEGRAKPFAYFSIHFLITAMIYASLVYC